MGRGPWWRDFGHLRVVLSTRFMRPGGPFRLYFWKEDRKWELALGYLEFRWRVHT